MKPKRDDFGVPIIEAENIEQLFFAFGYAQAEDHLIPMLLNFREAMGCSAEVLGGEALQIDVKSIIYGMEKIAQQDWEQASEEEKKVLRSFVEGINSFIRENEYKLPEWSRKPVEEKEILAFLRWSILQFGEATTINKLCIGSNQFAVAPHRTRNGTTIICSAPHLPWKRPYNWYEAHLKGAGFDVWGATFFGIPVVTMGHNRDIAWSYTVNPVNIGDIYEERLNLQGDKYLYEESWLDIEEEEVELKVREGGRILTERVKVRRTHHGPIIWEEKGRAFAIKLSLFNAESILRFLLRVARAQNLLQFKEAFRKPGFHMFNVLYGDRQGNIYYLFNALAPIRSPDYDWSKPVPGWTRETEWKGFHKFEELPQIENPPCGYIQNCNVDPTHITVEPYLKWDDFPPHLVEPAFTGRAKRLLSLLEANTSLSLDDAISYAFDVLDMTAEEWKPRLISAYNVLLHEIKEGKEILAYAINLLREWDNRDGLESKGSYLFGLWTEKFQAIEDKNELTMLLSLKSAAEETLNRFGKLAVRWGDVHIMRRGEIEYPTAGAGFPPTEALHLATGRLENDGKVVAEGGTSYIMLVELGEKVRSWSLLPYGNSEDPESSHFSDQAPLFSRMKLKPAFSEG